MGDISNGEKRRKKELIGVSAVQLSWTRQCEQERAETLGVVITVMITFMQSAVVGLCR